MTRRAAIIVLSVVVVLVVAAVIAGLWYVTRPLLTEDAPITEAVEEPLEEATEPSPQPIFEQQMFDEIKSPHYVSSTPANNALLKEAPTEVRVQFDFDLAEGSKIAVTQDGENATAGDTAIAADALSMNVPVNANKTGNYAVNYTACWPDGSCHDGSFGFTVRLEE